MLKNSEKLTAYDYRGACTFYLGAVLVVLVSQALAGIVSAALSSTYPDIATSGEFNTAFMIAVQLFNLAFIYFYTKIKRRSFDFTFFNRESDGKGITPAVIIVPVVCAAVLMVGMYLPTIWYGYLLNAMGVPEGYGDVELTSVASIVMIVIASVFLAPCFEETIYRGVLLHGLKHEKTELKAVLLSALAFMLMHMNPMQVTFQFALGVVAGYVVLRSGRLLPSVIMHASANALALVMQMTPLASSLAGSVEWLTQNVAAAVFITLGLFVGAGAALFFLVRLGFDFKAGLASLKRKPAEDSSGKDEAIDKQAAENGVASDSGAAGDGKAVEVRRELVRSDGTLKYWIGVGICAVMLIVNLVVGILS